MTHDSPAVCGGLSYSRFRPGSGNDYLHRLRACAFAYANAGLTSTVRATATFSRNASANAAPVMGGAAGAGVGLHDAATDDVADKRGGQPKSNSAQTMWWSEASFAALVTVLNGSHDLGWYDPRRSMPVRTNRSRSCGDMIR